MREEEKECRRGEKGEEWRKRKEEEECRRGEEEEEWRMREDEKECGGIGGGRVEEEIGGEGM